MGLIGAIARLRWGLIVAKLVSEEAKSVRWFLLVKVALNSSIVRCRRIRQEASDFRARYGFCAYTDESKYLLRETHRDCSYGQVLRGLRGTLHGAHRLRTWSRISTITYYLHSVFGGYGAGARHYGGSITSACFLIADMTLLCTTFFSLHLYTLLIQGLKVARMM